MGDIDMRTSIVISSLALGAALLCGSAKGQEIPPAPPLEAGAPIANSDLAPRAVDVASSRADRWRYKWHNGQWWYWLPSERWVIWVDDRWEDYLPPAPAAVTTYSYPRQTYYRVPTQTYYSYPYRSSYRGYGPSVGFYIGSGQGGWYGGGHHGGGHHGGGHHGGGHHGGGHHGGGHHGGGHHGGGHGGGHGHH